ncbi:uncharacterized protein EV420DRAFT_1485551 [Desarmillaria tabescens]|uniref:Uncharacterized protein n=1 Tax=Armillaria tabescens TaxID=1929756 RepID=A0AA39JH81_ARMTA|nr:uncharacterized protein EV420DRAFT_1485551 [Desarmillaria tabescens]KAK0441716.1 hypothetical protein EV420DRAFT_1485551 [Desarmillaria tabescens]
MDHMFLDLEAAIDNDALEEDDDSDDKVAERWISSGSGRQELNKNSLSVDYQLGTTANIHEFNKNDYPLWRVLGFVSNMGHIEATSVLYEVTPGHVVVLLIPQLSLKLPINQGQAVTTFHGHKLLEGFLLKKISSYGIKEATSIDLSVAVWDASTSTAIETTYWDLCKDFSPGDFIVATVDALKGHQGWVIEVHELNNIEVVVLEWNTDRNQMTIERVYPTNTLQNAETLMHERKLFDSHMLLSKITNLQERERSTSPVRGCTPPFKGEHPPSSEIITMEDAAWNPRANEGETLPKDHWIYNEVFKGKQLVVKADRVEKIIWTERDRKEVILWYRIGHATKVLKPKTLVPSHPTL